MSFVEPMFWSFQIMLVLEYKACLLYLGHNNIFFSAMSIIADSTTIGHKKYSKSELCLPTRTNHAVVNFSLKISVKTTEKTVENISQSDPQENCHLTVKKLPKTYIFLKKIAKNCHF